jgi:signal transduction histidine kinase/ActR/RegA family two-component response regulator
MTHGLRTPKNECAIGYVCYVPASKNSVVAVFSLFDALDDAGPEELRQRLRSLSALIERAPIPIAIAHDPGCRIITANRALGSLLGTPTDANISLTPAAPWRPLYRIQKGGRDIPPDELPMQYAIAHRTAVSNEIEIVRADGRLVYVQNDVEPLYDTHGQIYGCISVCVDLTERKLHENALREADRRKDEFLATLSHELRNPLAPIRTALEVMRIARDDEELVEKSRATMERQLTHLVRITDDLLDVSRITQNKVELRRERVDLRAALHSAIEATRSLLESRGHTVALDLPALPLWVDADFTRLSQVFSNLLNNAAKYTDPGGRVSVVANVTSTRAVVTVADTGVGIPAEMLPRVFDMFTQLQEHRDRTHGGLGIGLTLAKRLIELHGGSIEVSSEGVGRGTCVTVRLPVARPAAAGRSLRAQDTGAVSVPCRILVAEDNADAAEMMRLMLHFKGHDVRVAADGVQAVDVAAAFRPHIAFLDIGMPRMDGYEAARRIREVIGRRVVLVALTGWGQDEDKHRSRDAGFDHHLTKPPEPEVLERLIDECGATAADDDHP